MHFQMKKNDIFSFPQMREGENVRYSRVTHEFRGASLPLASSLILYHEIPSDFLISEQGCRDNRSTDEAQESAAKKRLFTNTRGNKKSCATGIEVECVCVGGGGGGTVKKKK